jgi:hypothetical protein
VEGPPLELAEMLEEYRHKYCNIYSSVFGSILVEHVRKEFD